MKLSYRNEELIVQHMYFFFSMRQLRKTVIWWEPGTNLWVITFSDFQMTQAVQLKSNLSITSLYVFDTILYADSVEWCPHEPNQHLFVCGNYQLDESPDSTDTETKKCQRFGKIQLFSIHETNGLTLHQAIDTAAVLDQKWCHNKINSHSLLGVVNAENTLEIYKLENENAKLNLVCSIKNNEDNVLMLSLDWSTGRYPSNEPIIVTSDSKGFVNLFKFSDNLLTSTSRLNAHAYEAWICAFYYWDPFIIFSGGDDCHLLKFDMRIGNNVQVKSSAHSAGVTSLHSNKEQEYLLASGSYDSNIFLWDIRNMKTPQGSIEMPGCLWRLKWNPHDYHNLLAACMRGGFHIINAFATDSPKITASYYEHEDLAYGSDWCFLNEEKTQNFDGSGNYIIAACSFYDHKLSVAKIKV